jgi:CheY-like chemotaxis protein/signal transduction histidine kinase/HAMP domain-containing protein
LALLAVLFVSALMGVRQNRELDDVQGRLVPKAELGPRIEAAFERLSRSMQDAVAAQDQVALDATIEQKAALFELISRAGHAFEPSSAAAMRWAVQDYYDTARDVARRMIAGEAGEVLVADVSRMQGQQAKAAALLKKTTSLDRDELGRAFGSVRGANNSADTLRLGVAALGTLAVALLAFWGARGMLQTIGQLTSGLARFGTGDFSRPIPITAEDELAAVAKEANEMAARLKRHAEQRDHDDWLKAGLSGLAEQLRGELLPAVVAERSLAFLAERLAAPVGELYLLEDDGSLHLHATYAAGEPIQNPGVSAQFKPGQGLLGQAVLSGEITLVDDLPADYVKIKSGIGEAPPRQLLLAPLVHFGRKAGVLELGLLKPASEAQLALLRTVMPTLVISIEAARAGEARSRLLAETQAQAEQLGAQEEELRLNNQELLAQQEELRRANEELDQQRTALGQQNAELQKARNVLHEKAEELKRVSAYKSQFLANMSHELRTPLNSMLLLSHLLSENESGNLTPKQVEHLRTVHSAGQDLLGLINEVLDLSKIEAGKQEVSLESVELNHFAGYARRLFEATAAQKGVQLVCELEADAPTQLVTDRQRVERILTNLLSNALKFTQRGQVTLRIGRPRGALAGVVSEPAVAFSVSDTGVGIPEAARERVFAAFEQVKGQTERHVGTGLGLPIARESARLLGGELILEESSPRGSVFVCVVPERANAQAAASPLAAPRKVDDDASRLGPDESHLLIIEDDRVLAEALVEIAHARRVKVVVASSGQEGLRIAQRGQTLGIVLDVKLPDVDGFSVMERLKHDEVTRNIPVHFVSGVDAPQRGLALGAVGYLVKPVSHAELSRVVRTLVPSDKGTRRILIVEDDAGQGGSVRMLLEREGFAATHVQTAAAALEALGTGEFGCMILDLGLPDMDGLGLLEKLRTRPELGAPRVVIHTGRELSKQETRELEAYAEAVVLKNGSSSERLLEEIRLFIRHVTDIAPAVVEAPLATPRVDVSLRGIKLLLAEDDMRTVYSLSALLRSKGADVVTAETGKEALEALAKHPDIRGVLMDVMMPEMDGYEAMRQLRRDERFVRLPVIALTAKAMKGERERCLEAGASDYLPKPVDGDTLLTKLSSWLTPGVA